MIKKRKLFDIHDYIEIALRRKWYVILPLGVSLLISFGVYNYLPKIYKATTLILVQPQTVPENYVRSTITDSVVGRLNTISQEILSRTRLEEVIHEFDLYADLRRNAPMEVIVEMMRNAIEVKVESPQNMRTQNSFSISYEGSEPRTLMLVTNKLASLFIEENVRFRESQAEGTSEFLSKELKAMDERLKDKDVEIRNFKERYMGQLPQQLDANLRILDRLQQQVQTTSENIRTAEDRMILIQNQIEQLRERGRTSPSPGSRGERGSGVEEMGGGRAPQDPLVTQWNQLKHELRNAQAKYTEKHPDVLDLKRKIAKLEPFMKEVLEKQDSEREARLRELKSRREADTPEDLSLTLDPASESLLAQYRNQYNEAQIQAKRLRAEEINIKKQIAIYPKRIEDTPRVEQELLLLTRDYDLLRSNYQSLLDKRIQSQMAQNLERKQQGEQFKVLDPARIPEKPIKPDWRKILYMGALIGLMVGVGSAWLRESLDQSFHTEADVEFYLGVPVIATVANRQNEKRRYRALQRAGK